MTEARRFMRYVAPSSVFAVLVFLELSLVLPEWTLRQIDQLRDNAGIGFAIAAIGGAGGLGYLFSVIHHTLHWWRSRGEINHEEIVRGLLVEDDTRNLGAAGPSLEIRRLKVVDKGESWVKVKKEEVNRERALATLSALWYTLADGNSLGHIKAESLSDTAHSAGTARVAATAAAVVSAGVVLSFGTSAIGTHQSWFAGVRIVFALLIWVVAPLVLHASYRRVSRLAQLVIEQVFLELLQRSDQSPVRAYVAWTEGNASSGAPNAKRN